MKKIAVFFCVAVVVLVCFAPAIYATGAEAIQSPLLEPVPETFSDTEGLHVKIQWVRLEQRNTREIYCLHVYDAVFPSGAKLRIDVFFNGFNSAFRSTDQPLSGTHEVYNVETGDFVYSSSITLSNWNSTIDSISYRYGLQNVNNTVNNGFFAASDSFVVDPPWESAYNIIWAHEEIPLNYYNSLLSEPVSDDYNRYFALVGSGQKYLFQVHFWVSEMITLQLSNPDQTTETYFNVTDLFAPVLRLNNNQLSLHYECIDTDMLDLLNATTQAVIQGLRIQITKYDFYTGQYIDSYLFTDFTVAGYSYDFNYNLGSYNDYDAVGIWGIYYDSFDSSYHYNKLTCHWSYDQSFAEWQAETLRYLQLIYNVLSEQPAEEPTINDDMSAADEVHNVIDSLTPTDQNGNKIDTADRVESELDRANMQIEDLREGVGTLNETMEGFLFLDPLFYVPLLVGLALGLVITILGKNKSG